MGNAFFTIEGKVEAKTLHTIIEEKINPWVTLKRIQHSGCLKQDIRDM